MRSLTVVQLYPNDMNIYGDNGNLLVLTKRLEQREYEANVVKVSTGDPLPDEADLIIAGGGQDSGQFKVADDLQTKAEQLKKLADDDVPMLVVCGTYQLFGKRFKTETGDELKGISIFDMETEASDQRLIGNVVADSEFGLLVGYENHSGQTTLGEGAQPLATVTKGAGNNAQDKTEGAIYKNAIGTYLHGPILPKSPKLADELIKRAIARKYGEQDLTPLDDTLAEHAADVARSRPR